MSTVPDYRRTDPHGNAAQALYAAEAREFAGDIERHNDSFTPPTLSPAGRHFVELASVDETKTLAPSDGERRARRIATVLLDDVGGLDNEALAGMCEFAVLAATYPQTMRAMLNQETT